MPHLLLTNDDGVDSPALLPFIHALDGFGDVTTVVPDRERSWIGKAISRHGEVHTQTVTCDGHRITTCSGYPADAIQLGVHHICDPTPDLVVSGINIGLNHGTGFMLSSGTVGAAIEGWISGRPAIAFSTGVTETSGSAYRQWRRHAWSGAATTRWAALAATCTAILADVVDSGLPSVADIVSVNLPFDATPDTPRRLTQLARLRYGALFRPVGDGRYRAGFVGADESVALAGTDAEALDERAVSITPIGMPAAIDPPAGLRARVETGPSPLS